jgi:hypothetical protein
MICHKVYEFLMSILNLYIDGRIKVWLGGVRQTRFWVGELQVGGVPQILNLEARMFWQRFVSPNHPQKLFQNM